MAALGPWVLLIGLVYVQASAVAADLGSVRDQLANAEASLAATEVADADDAVANARQHSERARSRSHGFVFDAARVVPLIGPQARGITSLADASTDLVTAAERLVDGAERAPLLADRGGSLEATNLRAALDAVEPAVASLRAASSTIDSARARLEGNVDWLFGPVAAARTDARERLEDVTERIESALGLITLGRELTEPGRVTRFLLVSQDTWELRPSGGFIGSFGLVELRDGELDLVTYDDATELPPPSEPYAPFLPFAEVLGGPEDLTGAGWWPDFPTSARAAQELYLRQGGVPVDGVIGMTQHVLEELMPAFGPMTVPGYPDVLTAENVADRILHHVELKRPLDVPRKRFLELLTDEVFEKLGALDREHVPLAARGLGRALQRRDLQLYLNDPAQQRALERSGWAGALSAADSGDVLAVIDANWGIDKANRWVRRDISYYVSWVDGHPTAQVTVRTEHSGEETSINPAYRSFVRVYTPPGTEVLGDRVEQFGLTESSESGLTTLARDQLVPVGATGELQFRYRLPDAVIEDGRYRLRVVPQAGTHADDIEVVVNLDGSPRSHTFSASDGPQEIVEPASRPGSGSMGRLERLLDGWRGFLRR